MIFGAVKRDAPAPTGGPLQVIITLAGPQETVVVRRKERVLAFGPTPTLWKWIPHRPFYAVATSAPLGEVLSSIEDLRYGISIPV